MGSEKTHTLDPSMATKQFAMLTIVIGHSSSTFGPVSCFLGQGKQYFAMSKFTLILTAMTEVVSGGNFIDPEHFISLIHNFLQEIH